MIPDQSRLEIQQAEPREATTKDGRYIWIYDEGLFFVDAENQILVQGFMMDITARKIAEEEFLFAD